MQNAIADVIPNVPGAAFAGGFYAGLIRVGDAVFALIVAPKAEGQHDDGPWNKSSKRVEGAQSYFDGYANTLAMADAGSELARWALDLRIGGHDDWYLPSRDELEICYRNLKPTKEENWTHRNGDNPSSVPAGYPYTDESPGQTAAEAFQHGDAEAFDDVWYWSSTQCASTTGSAWVQDFSSGYQGSYRKGSDGRARAVRRLKI